MKKIIGLKKINKNVDFTFYNAKQANYDFGKRGKNTKAYGGLIYITVGRCESCIIFLTKY